MTLATALRAELDRLPRFGRARFVHADRLEPLLVAHTDVVDALVLALARATGTPEGAVRLGFGLADPGAGSTRERCLNGDDSGTSCPDRPTSNETGDRP